MFSLISRIGSECPNFRRANANKNSLEEARTLLEQSDRTRRNVEQELADTNESLSDLTCQNQAICGAKLKCEQVRVVTMCNMSSSGHQEMCSLNAGLEEMMGEAKMSEDKAQRTMMDAARLADELRAEQEVSMALERDKKLLEAQAKDAQARVDEAETSALKGLLRKTINMEHFNNHRRSKGHRQDGD